MIRPATADDAAACAAIYAPCVSDSIISFEARPPEPSEIARRIQAAHLWLVAEQAGEVCGYAYGSPHREREAYQWAADVAIYIDGRHRGRGLGRALYEQLFDGLRDRGLYVVCAGVALPNPASEALHRTTGFAEVGVYRRIGFKLDRWVDVRWYQRSLRAGTETPPPLRKRDP
jgi:L-amino acid N-acyltransferase YncA